MPDRRWLHRRWAFRVAMAEPWGPRPPMPRALVLWRSLVWAGTMMMRSCCGCVRAISRHRVHWAAPCPSPHPRGRRQRLSKLLAARQSPSKDHQSHSPRHHSPRHHVHLFALCRRPRWGVDRAEPASSRRVVGTAAAGRSPSRGEGEHEGAHAVAVGDDGERDQGEHGVLPLGAVDRAAA